MAYHEAFTIQFLDWSGADEDEKNSIMSSLQVSSVRGPWNNRVTKKTEPKPPECITVSTNLPAQQNYQHYQGSPVMITNHVNSMSPVMYQQAYQQPMYHHHQAAAFVAQPLQYVAPMVNGPAVLPVTMVPVNAVMNPMAPCVPAIVSVSNTYTYQTYPVQQQPHSSVETNVDELIPKQNPTDVVISIKTEERDTEEEIFGAVNEDEAPNGYKEEVESPWEPAKFDLVAERNKSWASLFNKGSSAPTNHGNTNGNHEPIKATPKAIPFVNSASNQNDGIPFRLKRDVAAFGNPSYYRMAEILVDHNVDHHIISLQPRGLINRSNYCYINSILQALLACPPFYNLLSALSENVAGKDNRKMTQIIDIMAKFVKEFRHLPQGQRVSRRSDNKSLKKEQTVSINCDKTFEPFWIYKMLNGIRSDSFVVEGRQEDAEEFLCCLLNGLNDEMLELMKLLDGPEDSGSAGTEERGADGDKEWQVMGPKNKGSVTRRTEVNRTPISDIFGGNIRLRINRAGDQVTDDIQPFFTLQLNIEKVTTVREAMEALVSKIQLEGVTSSRTNEQVEAWQQVTIEELPVVLILHLKCFDFKPEGCTKIVKALDFPIDLKIDSKLLSSKSYQAKEKQYKLFAVVYHDGKEATKGHYVTDAYHVGYASWIRYDDSVVKPVQEEQVLKPQGTRVPYLLFYRRSDTVRNK